LRLKLRACHQLNCAQVTAQGQTDKRISVKYQVKIWSFKSGWVQVGSQIACISAGSEENFRSFLQENEKNAWKLGNILSGNQYRGWSI